MRNASSYAFLKFIMDTKALINRQTNKLDTYIHACRTSLRLRVMHLILNIIFGGVMIVLVY